MGDLDEELEKCLTTIEEGKSTFSEDEQNIINSWIAKLSEPKDTDEEKNIRNDYAWTLAKMVTEVKELVPPFSDLPDDDDLIPLPDVARKRASRTRRGTFSLMKMPCARPKPGGSRESGAIPKGKKMTKPSKIPTREELDNEFEDPEEMARILAMSKGYSFAEFVAAISRHTIDHGQKLRTCMKLETTNFREYVDHVLCQRIKDLTEVLDEEQNAELQKIKKDIDKWQLELSHCKKRIREIIPDFDIDLYRRDKNYLKRIFTVDASPKSELPEDDSFKKWKEESCHRLQWYSEKVCKLTQCNDQITQEMNEIKTKTFDLEAKEAMKQQSHIQYMNCEISGYQKQKMELDKLHKENAELLSQLEAMCE